MLITRKISVYERIILKDRNNRRIVNSISFIYELLGTFYGEYSRLQGARWAIPGSLRLPMVDRLGEIVCDPEAQHRDVRSAVSAILTASEISLARRIDRLCIRVPVVSNSSV